MALLPQILMLLLAVGASLGQCPPREDILPCTCRERSDDLDNYNILVFCQKVDDVDDVRRALQSVKGIKGVSVEFYNSRLGSVPSDLFKGLNVIRLFFENCILRRYGDEGRSALEGLEDSLEYFGIQESYTEDNNLKYGNNHLKFVNVSSLNALKYLRIVRNNIIEEFGNEWFAEGPANLEYVTLIFNKIAKLGDRAFTQLKNIRSIWLWNNRIEIITRSMFPSPAVHLKTFVLATNKISSLPVDIFSDMPALKNVQLDSNSIKSIPEVTWKPVWSKLNHLDLSENPLNCNEAIEWILKLKRPSYVLGGKCVSPDERKGIELKKIIDDAQRDK